MPNITTRFAPSPTGALHIGGARTALFNWLLAQHAQAQNPNSKMLLRIEDTDTKRSTPENVETIINSLTWLGLNWHGEAVSQRAQANRHAGVVQQLINSGHAYPCYCTRESLIEKREKARTQGTFVGYDGTCRDKPKNAPNPDHIKPTWRFRTPQIGETIVNDLIQGKTSFPNEALDDLIILRDDGSPTYNLSVVVDDHDMGVTHIVRGVDHLTNAARQSQIYTALGWDIPQMAHIPLIHGEDGAKLSKRHGALSVEAYREQGFIAPAMINYLVRLGWSHGDDEIFSTPQLINLFSLENIGKSAARLNLSKLEHLNAHYLRESSPAQLLDFFMDFLSFTGETPLLTLLKENQEIQTRFLKGLPLIAMRCKTLVEIQQMALYLWAARPLALEERAKKQLTLEAIEFLAKLEPHLQKLKEWSTDEIEQCLKAFCRQMDIKAGKIGQPLRATLTGTTSSPGIYDVMYMLGQEETLLRIRDQLTT